MATTAVFGWELVPENADPAWWAFDRLVCQVDATLAAQRQRLSVRPPFPTATLVFSSMATVAIGKASATSFQVLSGAPRGPITGPLTVVSGTQYLVDVCLQDAASDLPNGGRARLIAEPGTLNLTGDSLWWSGGALANGMHTFTVVVSLAPGAYALTVEGFHIAGTNAQLLVYPL